MIWVTKSKVQRNCEKMENGQYRDRNWFAKTFLTVAILVHLMALPVEAAAQDRITVNIDSDDEIKKLIHSL